jgi:hypothetical protein
MTPRSDSDPDAADEEIRHLQEVLLGAVLSRQPLPGRERPILLPDLDFVLRGDLVVADENVAGTIALEGTAKPLRVLSPETIEERARRSGGLPYLRFQPVEREGDLVWLTLEGRIAPGAPDERPLGLSGVRVPFRKAGDGWLAADDAVVFAA